MTRVDEWLERLQGILLPYRCVLCGTRVAGRALDLCGDCESDLPPSVAGCVICAEPIAASGATRCGACLRQPPWFDVVRCPFRYAYPLDHLVRVLKYRGAVAEGRVLGELLASYVQRVACATLPQVVLPVPLAARRYRERGYNQAVELARRIECRLGIAMRTDLVERTRETREQAALDRRQRRRNIRGAFAMSGSVMELHVAIVDDVVTTGSTVNEMARVLKEAGAKSVEVWAVARASRG